MGGLAPVLLAAGLLAGLAVAAWWLFWRQPPPPAQLPPHLIALLGRHVPYYREVRPADRADFHAAAARFLAEVRFHGAGTEVADVDRVLVAAAAAALRYRSPHPVDWGITEVVLQPGDVDEVVAEALEGTVGLVDHPDFHRSVVLSQADLRACARGEIAGDVAAHELAHLVDRARGGEPDGLPYGVDEAPWRRLAHDEMDRAATGYSLLDEYAAEDAVEFFAVASEYFVAEHAAMRRELPRLHAALTKVYGPVFG